MKKWQCSVCGYVYNPEVTSSVDKIPAGTDFEKLQESWRCPRCGAGKSSFSMLTIHKAGGKILRIMYGAEDLTYFLIALVLFVSAFILIGVTLTHFQNGLTTLNILNCVNDMLLVVIILELVSTVLIYLTERRISIKPFLLIGVISSVRRILIVGAQMSIHVDTTPELFRMAIIELVVNAGIIIILVGAFVLLSKVPPTLEQCAGCLGVEKRVKGGSIV